MRMRLHELMDVAAVFEKGGVASEAIDALRREALSELVGQDTFCSIHFPELVAELRRGLQARGAESLLPGGAALAGATAALRHLGDNDPLARISEHLGQAMQTANDRTELETISGLVELLDAELAYEEHAIPWRRELIDASEKRQSEGEPAHEAIGNAMRELRVGSVRRFDVVVPLAEAASGRIRAWLQPEDADKLAPVIAAWSDPSVLDQWEGDWGWGQRYPDQHAADRYAAAELAAQRFRRDTSLWQLAGGRATWPGVVFVEDTDARSSSVIRIPLEELPLAPPGLEAYQNSHPYLDDAVGQLAQARAASPSTALADVWTAAETAFGGVTKDPRHEVAADLAGLAAALYPHDLLTWLASRCGMHGIELELPGEPPPARLLATILTPGLTGPTLRALLDAGDLLAWHRLRGVCRWSGGGLDREVAVLRKRMEQVGNRAYLMRNFAVHRAEWRMRALPVTLPIFADLVRTCVGYLLVQPDEARDLPLVVAKQAAMTVLRVAALMREGPDDPRIVLAPLLRR